MTIIRLSRPLHLLFTVLAFSLGVSVAHYLGIPFSISAFVFGLTWACVIQVCTNLLIEVFRPVNETILPGQYGADRVYLRDRLLFISLGLLVLEAGCAYMLYLFGHINPASVILLGLSLLILIAFAVHPLKFHRRGYGELLLSAQLGYIFPSLGFVLQSGDFHSFIPILAIPISLLALAYFIVLDFKSFEEDTKYERVTLLTLLGWQRAIQLHNGSVVLAFIALGFSPLAGISPALLWPASLSLPFAVLQILLFRGIRLGAPPLWKMLTLTATTLFALPIYLLAFSFFLR